MAEKKNKDEAKTPDEESKIEAKGEESESDTSAGGETAGGAAGMKGASGQCVECGSELYDGKCINAECKIGQRQWSKSAARDTAKATVPAPAAVTRAGRVD